MLKFKIIYQYKYFDSRTDIIDEMGMIVKTL